MQSPLEGRPLSYPARLSARVQAVMPRPGYMRLTVGTGLLPALGRGRTILPFPRISVIPPLNYVSSPFDYKGFSVGQLPLESLITSAAVIRTHLAKSCSTFTSTAGGSMKIAFKTHPVLQAILIDWKFAGDETEIKAIDQLPEWSGNEET